MNRDLTEELEQRGYSLHRPRQLVSEDDFICFSEQVGAILMLPDDSRFRKNGVRRIWHAQSSHIPESREATRVGAMGLHTDGLSYEMLPPDIVGMQMVCPAQEGGETILIDGQEVIQKLTPETRSVLQATPCIQLYRNEQQLEARKRPILITDRLGHYRLLFNEAILSILKRGNQPAGEDLEEAVLSTQPVFDKKLALGDILLLDNSRMLHGRRDYSDNRRKLNRLWIRANKQVSTGIQLT